MLVLFRDTLLTQRPSLQQHLFAIHQWHYYRLQWPGWRFKASWVSQTRRQQKCFSAGGLNLRCFLVFMSPAFHHLSMPSSKPTHQRMGVTGVFKSNLGQGASTRGASRRWLGTNMFEIWLWMMDYKKIAGYIRTQTSTIQYISLKSTDKLIYTIYLNLSNALVYTCLHHQFAHVDMARCTQEVSKGFILESFIINQSARLTPESATTQVKY